MDREGQVEEGVSRSTNELQGPRGSSLERVYISEGLTEVPGALRAHAPGVRFLDLSRNRLTTLPDWFVEFTSLEVVFLSFNLFSHVPEVLGRLPSLKMIGMRNNQVEHLTDSALPTSLRWLTLTNNFLERLPDQIGRLPQLQKLLVAGNRLKSLPETLAGNRALELIRLSANKFESFPTWLWELPGLAWIAVAGNPCSQSMRGSVHHQDVIYWNQLEVGGELGRGASGQTFRATVRNSDGSVEDVAVKIFAASVSSDGDAADEMFAALVAGRHPHIVSTRGRLADHPEGKMGLILDIVPESFRNLAKPPSFDSCTRDVYSADERLSYAQMVSYATGIAQAALHLHRNGVIHGDLYAHNTLVSADCARISDFGAACVYGGNPVFDGELLERIEVRAFGIFLRELLARATGDSDDSRLAAVRVLVDACEAPCVRERPRFADILSAL